MSEKVRNLYEHLMHVSSLYWLIKRGLVQVSSREHLSDAVWILLSSFGATDTKPMEDFFRGMYIPLDCEFLVAHRLHSDVIISEVYHLDRHLPLNRNYFGTWRHGLGVTITNISFMERRNDLQGFVMNVATMTVSKVIGRLTSAS
jgi:hypothetical protein